ncbi:MAG: Ig-like domain-containing protein, partial [Thermoguttaceae bacterium]
MRILELSDCLITFGTRTLGKASRKSRRQTASNRKPWCSRIEPLERRELLSVAPNDLDKPLDDEPVAIAYEGSPDDGLVTIDNLLFADQFEDNAIDPTLWTIGGSRRAATVDDPAEGQWSLAHYETILDEGSEDGYLQMRVDGPESATTFGAEAWIRTTYDYNDGDAHTINFTWATDVLESHYNHYQIQITDGYVPTAAENNDLNWAASGVEGTTDLLWGVDGGESVPYLYGDSSDPISTWSILIDPTGTAKLYSGADGTGDLLHEGDLADEGPWHVRLMVTDGTGAGFSAGDARLNLYAYDSSSHAVNHAPESAADSYEMYEGSSLTIDPADGVLANDVDPDGDSLTAAVVTGPAHGSVTLGDDGSFEYRPDDGYSGTDTFTYRASDGELESDPIVVTVTVSPVNSVAGSVFEDIDADALRDINEGGLEGWTLQIDPMGTSGELVYTLMRPTNGAPDTDTGLETSVAFLGDDILVGAVFDDTGAVDTGAVHLYDGETGQYIRSFVNPTGNTRDRFGAVVTAYGDDVLITATGQWGYNTGVVYLFDGDTGDLLSTFTSPAAENGIKFGASIAVVGDKLLVGSPQRDYNYLAQNGAAYLFDIPTGELLNTFTNPGPYPADKFGRYVAALGDTIVISAAGNLDRSGVYQFDATSGELLHTFFDPEPDREGLFGVSMAVVGGDVLIGSTLGNWDSPAYLFDGQTGELLQTFETPNSYSRLGDFGSAAVAVGDNILIGAQYEYTDQAWSGKAFLFDRATGEVLQTYTSEH